MSGNFVSVWDRLESTSIGSGKFTIEMPTEIKITGDTLLIRIRRPTALALGLIAFALFVLIYAVFI